MMTDVYAYEEAPLSYHASIFLIGPTPRKQDDPSWRPEALRILSEMYPDNEFHLVVFVPESREGPYRYLEQVEWEKRHLDMADVLLTWLPRDMNTSLKGLTTNVEFGKYLESGKLFYGRPDHADHVKYLDWIYTEVTKRQPSHTLRALSQEVGHYLNSKLEHMGQLRQAGERYVPLHIWVTTQFQSWYQSQKRAGNQLLDAKVLWTFLIHKVNCTFSYALHVHVWIASENRIKSNEFILSRPDISVVVPYWKHPTSFFDSEVVLIKEFRSPARTQDSFVHELPGGSHFEPGDELVVASDELYEETSVRIAPHRFKYIDSKQLVTTWSTHFAHVYAVELARDEMNQIKNIMQSGETFGVSEDSEKTYVEVHTLRNIEKLVDWSTIGMIYQTLLA